MHDEIMIKFVRPNTNSNLTIAIPLSDIGPNPDPCYVQEYIERLAEDKYSGWDLLEYSST